MSDSENKQPEQLDNEDHSPDTSPSKPRSGNQKILGFLINALLVIIIGIVILLVWDRLQNQNTESGNLPATEAVLTEETPPTEMAAESGGAKVNLSPYATVGPFDEQTGVSRNVEIHTTIPTRSRVEVITYTVELGDSIFSIADLFSLDPETILWGNYDVLKDDPHLLTPGQVLSILPINGTYHVWAEGDSLAQIAAEFDASVEDIIEYPGNRFDLTMASLDDPGLEIGEGLIIPGGSREIQDWGPPAITRDNPASAAYYGGGSCGSVYTGAIGYGTFVWPTTERYLSGYTYNPPVHNGIDIAGDTGNAIFATDSGVVVYAGWSNYGYGNLIVLDHGTGWQSAYAHLSAISVGCGQSVSQGSVIGALGNTGNSSGSHLHFELVNGGAKLNPLNFLQ